MNTARQFASAVCATDRPATSARGLAAAIAVLFLAQVALILALGERGSKPVRPPAAAPVLRLASDEGELLALTDPTLFVLPHPHGVAARAWWRRPLIVAPADRWSESPRWLSLAPDALGASMVELARALRPVGVEPGVNPIPEIVRPTEIEPMPRPPDRSALVLAEAPAGRRLLQQPALPQWPAADWLTNSVVRVLIDGDGLVRSATLLGRSGSAPADAFALETARRARFEPATAGAGESALAAATLVFVWSTLPATNAPPASP